MVIPRADTRSLVPPLWETRHDPTPDRACFVPPRHLLVALAVAFGAGCNTVEFYAMRAFSDPAMALDVGATKTHWYQKVYYSTEGSAGGIGTSAGGGCGCY